ncbi:AbrB/MazE/SpoVT family DNA-binding domain-containing protein [uncultured Methanoregula sp.]|uniref:AbrB/MazE/SpoVT family DNA-binding domain-containing protein n=1 Tax=uncultured Methanoregula sp. TaxID=1005933 RepID=UPI002AABBEAD|nr:AbrB/MazE/SpoVT family DNA-binding domain-containing protein [uncultured Methanoregula sp.]
MPEKENTVKSRLHHGSNSLDLTIPSEIVKSWEINPGDVFRLVVTGEGDNLVLQYERVYSTKG